MARINIEDSIYKDARFIDLVIKLGSVETALGALVRAWVVAQKYWIKDCSLIPFEVWESQRLNAALIDVKLAVKRDTGYYMIGSEEQFDWLLKRVRAGQAGGARSAEARRREINDLDSSNAQANPSKRKQIQPSLLITHYSSNSVINTRDQGGAGGTAPPKATPSHWLMDLWNEKSRALPKCKGLNPARLRRINQRLAEHPTPDDWRQVIESLASSRFCNGENDRGWRATFDFLIQPETFLKVIEGKYANVEPKRVINWVEEAQAIMSAIRSSSLRDRQPAERLERMRAAGLTWARMGQWPDNDFTIKKIAGLLRAAGDLKQPPSELENQ